MGRASPKNWNTAELAAATGGQAFGVSKVEGVGIDSRKVENGELFVALQGVRFDGHEYVKQALEAGASLAMVSRVPDGCSDNGRLLLVQETMAALRSLAKAARQKSKAYLIGVTGSVGKTGTKEMLRICFSTQGSVHASAKSHNNDIGVPLTLANLGSEVDYAVVEMGMNHSGEIREHSFLARPDMAIITSIAETHIGNFSSLSEIAEAKAEIFSGLEAPGVVVLNRDSRFYAKLRKASQNRASTCLTFGEAADATVRLVECQRKGHEYRITASVAGKNVCYRLGTPGLHWVYNSLGAIACVYGAGGDVQKAAMNLESFQLMAGRGRSYFLKLGSINFTVIDESYNASPASVSAALKVLRDSSLAGSGRRIAVLGDMLELGRREQVLHAALSEDIVEAGVSVVFAIGSRMLYLSEALPLSVNRYHFDNVHAAIEPLMEDINEGDVILIKGSFSIQMGLIVSALRSRSQEVEVV
ncbi:MAG: UDP-N-acetylmuramoylalanyl-D-glutamyl-2, 6-diaminopimelate--D-alanyl-D-alanine ligase [Rhodospirillaceae bacterium]|nr:UDP-N-acetylmuramoylalanyl-D-glutamyl-2, 6-diaminopimelate--D-alanyl-D-alanine ligase [Rhodospirillaceae bacterium]